MCVRSSRTAANAYSQEFYYNINMQTGADVTLEDLLGPDWRELCNQAVTQGIAQRLAQDPNAIYYTTEDDDPSDDEFAFGTVTEDQSFYINERGEPCGGVCQIPDRPGLHGHPGVRSAPAIKEILCCRPPFATSSAKAAT